MGSVRKRMRQFHFQYVEKATFEYISFLSVPENGPVITVKAQDLGTMLGNKKLSSQC